MSADWDIEELAGYAMGKTEMQVEEMINNSTCEDELMDRYGVDFLTYCKIVQDLLPLTPIVETAIIGTAYHAFVVRKKGYSEMVLRKEAGLTT